MSFENTIHVQMDGRDNGFVLARATVEHVNGRNYSVGFLFQAEVSENKATGDPMTLWSCRLNGASFKDAKGARRFVSERHTTLRHDLFFVPHQLVRNHLVQQGYIN
jgi:hypothetical protein